MLIYCQQQKAKWQSYLQKLKPRRTTRTHAKDAKVSTDVRPFFYNFASANAKWIIYDSPQHRLDEDSERLDVDPGAEALGEVHLQPPHQRALGGRKACNMYFIDW